MGNTEILKRGSIQLTSSGTGVSLCDETYGSDPVHSLQFWAFPSIPHLPPRYFIRYFADSEKVNKWACVVAPIGTAGISVETKGDGPAPVQSPLSLYATILSEGKHLEHKMTGTKGYIHVLQTQGYNRGEACGATVRIIGGGVVGDNLLLKEGDGAYMRVGRESGTILYVENVGDRVAEVLLLDLE
jgi:redox-sensitive bicupin YhaK (pirin superfamily)